MMVTNNIKYIILADSSVGFETPRQLTMINGEPIIARTIRLLKNQGVKDIILTAHDTRFDNLGATRYEPKFNDYIPKKAGYWVSAFPIELLNQPICFLFGDVYYSENAIKTIVNTETNGTMFFCSYQNKDCRYIKKHDEPLGYKIVDYELFKKHIQIIKDFKDSGQAIREPIVWELYRSINGIPIKEHKLTTNYTAINDESCDIDTQQDINKLRIILGGNMIKLVSLQEFSLGNDPRYTFDKLQNIVRKNPRKAEQNSLYEGDEFECDKAMADYLTGGNDKGLIVARVIDVPKPIEETQNQTTKRNNKAKKSKK